MLLEIGGSHVTGALDSDGDLVRRSLDGRDFFAVLDEVLAGTGTPPGTWGVALPGPFDLARGVGRYGGTGKLEDLDDVDLGAALRARGATAVAFVNDADAFGLGAWTASRPRRLVALTLGSGVGSAFVDVGALVLDRADVPPEGSAHLLTWQGRPLEETFSRTALRRAWAARFGTDLDVHEIVARPEAAEVLAPAVQGLVGCLRPWLERFEAEVVVVGGSIARSWDLLATWADLPGAVVDTDERTALRGAAAVAARA